MNCLLFHPIFCCVLSIERIDLALFRARGGRCRLIRPHWWCSWVNSLDCDVSCGLRMLACSLQGEKCAAKNKGAITIILCNIPLNCIIFFTHTNTPAARRPQASRTYQYFWSKAEDRMKAGLSDIGTAVGVIPRYHTVRIISQFQIFFTINEVYECGWIQNPNKPSGSCAKFFTVWYDSIQFNSYSCVIGGGLMPMLPKIYRGIYQYEMGILHQQERRVGMFRLCHLYYSLRSITASYGSEHIRDQRSNPKCNS